MTRPQPVRTLSAQCPHGTQTECGRKAPYRTEQYSCCFSGRRSSVRAHSSRASSSAHRDVLPLKHCRCTDCQSWLEPPYSMCMHGIIINGVVRPPEYPDDAWHWCALYVEREVVAGTGGKDKSRPAPVRGRTVSGPLGRRLAGGEPSVQPVSGRPGENRPYGHYCTTHLNGCASGILRGQPKENRQANKLPINKR